MPIRICTHFLCIRPGPGLQHLWPVCSPIPCITHSLDQLYTFGVKSRESCNKYDSLPCLAVGYGENSVYYMYMYCILVIFFSMPGFEVLVVVTLVYQYTQVQNNARSLIYALSSQSLLSLYAQGLYTGFYGICDKGAFFLSCIRPSASGGISCLFSELASFFIHSWTNTATLYKSISDDYMNEL